eukprot:TRINITY_DN103343_c0_g1_i1.p1 TRINITY_DN103343_c0_g1~~TRINITY_DN103343_c0_g1_i1.p1  ORF type:complete len:377 (-),score=67.59 TRINITY_DN103343_c0_g1_i1:395-1483(-)
MALMFDFSWCCAARDEWSEHPCDFTESAPVESQDNRVQGELEMQASETANTQDVSSNNSLRPLFAFAVSLAAVAGALVGLEICSLALAGVMLLVAVACALKAQASQSWSVGFRKIAHHPADDLPQHQQPVARKEPELTKSSDAVATLMAGLDQLALTDPSLELDENTCRRFLTAYKGDIDGAAKGLQSYVQWRKEVRPSEITAEDVKVELATRKGYVGGLDRRGQPILWAFAGRHDKNVRDIDETEKLILLCMERAVSLGRTHGSDKICLVFDLSGFGPKSMDYEIVKRLFLLLARFYPERLGQILMCNAPSIFSMFWRVVSPYIDPVTFQKIRFVRRGELSEFIDAGTLPQDDAKLLELMS